MIDNNWNQEELFCRIEELEKKYAALQEAFNIRISESKQTELMLQKSEAKYKQLAESATTIVYRMLLKPELKFDYVSPSATEITGYTPEDHYRDPQLGFKLVHPEDRILLENTTRYSNGEPLELRWIRKDGQVIWTEQRNVILFDESNEPCAIEGNARDITDRKLAEEQLRESEVQYRNLANSGSALIWTSGTDRLCNYFNETWLRFTGRTLEQEMGNGWAEGVHPDDFKRCLETYLTAFDRQEPFEMEYRLLHSSGQYKWILDLGTPNFNSAGVFIGYIGHCFDISERKNIEIVLHEREEKYRNIFETMQDTYYEATPDGILVELSPSIEILSKGQYCRSEMIGKSFVGIYADPKDRNIFFTELFKHGKVSDYELRLFNKDGSIIPVSVSSKLLYDPFGQPARIAGIIRDITERKNVEIALKETLEQLNQSNLYLERRVEERTREIRELSHLHQAILRNAGLAIICTSPQGIIEVFNTAAEAMLGYSAAEVVGKYTPVLFHDQEEFGLDPIEMDPGTPQVFRSDFRMIQKIIEKCLNQTVECTYIRNGGERFPVKLTVSAVRDTGDNLLGYIGISSDISQEKIASQALRESESINRAILQAVPDLMFRIRRDGTYLDSHSQNESSLLVPREHFIGKKVSEVLPADLALQSMDVIGKAFATGNVEQYVYMLTVGDKELYFENRIIAISEDEVLSIIRDITGKKIAENELQKTLQQLSTLIQNLQAGTLFENKSRHITLVNQSFCNLFNVPATPEQMVGYDCEVASGESKQLMKDPEGFIRQIDEILLRGEIVVNDELYLRDGRVLERDYIPIKHKDDLLGHLWQYRDITRRKETETALKMQIAAFESFALSIIITDISGRIKWVNSAFTKLSGYSVEEAIGKSSGELVKSGSQNKAFYNDFWDTLLNRRVWSGELINRRSDGSLYYEEETITPVLDAQGNISSFIAVKIDITERKKLYQELADEKRRLADIIKGTNAGTWEWNIQTGETIFNEQWGEMLGYTLDEISPLSIETWMKFAHPDDLKVSGELLERHFNGTLDYYSFESRMKHKNGSWIWVLDRGRVHKWDNEGKPLLMSGTHQDITEQKRAEIALLESDRKHISMISNISDVIGIMDVNGVVKYKSPNIEKYFGWKPEDLIGTEGWQTIHPDDFERIQKEFLLLLQKEKESKTVEYKYKCKDGSYKAIELTAVNLVNDAVINGILLNYHDITIRKQVQEALIEAKDEAIKANQAKSEFLSRMSHELRTPMNSILGFAQLMDMGDLNPKQKKGVNHILNNGRHLLSLINEVLDISGIEAGRQVLIPEPIHLKGIINEITDIIQVAANKKRISIELIDAPANMLYVLADKLRLKQILINLLNNAIKYNKEGGSVTIKAALREAHLPGNIPVRISVSDSGNGIKPEDISKLFQPFERIGADKTQTEGTGLGLMVVKKLTEALGGSVGVVSEVGVGSTFWIELPLSDIHTPDTLQTSGFLAPQLPETILGETILYIEDNISNIELVQDILAQYRPAIQLVTSMFGKHTLKLAREHKPGLILLDLDLPDIHGNELLDKLLEDDFTKSIPVIIISADAMPFQIEKLMKVGAKDYLTKPLDLIQFLNALDKNLKTNSRAE